MTKQSLKKSTQSDEFICLTCTVDECVPGGIDCPVGGAKSAVDNPTYYLVKELFAERDRLRQLKIDLEAEIRRVKKLKTGTTSKSNKLKADTEIVRLRTILQDTELRSRGLNAKHIADKLELPLHVVTNIGKVRHR